MNWAELLPATIAEQQIAWERRHSVLRAREAGATLGVIGARVGFSRERVRQLSEQARREIGSGRRSPVERYFTERPVTGHVQELTPKEFKVRLRDAKRRRLKREALARAEKRRKKEALKEALAWQARHEMLLEIDRQISPRYASMGDTLFAQPGYLAGVVETMQKGEDWRIIRVTGVVNGVKVRTFRIVGYRQTILDEPKLLAFPTLEKAEQAATAMGLT